MKITSRQAAEILGMSVAGVVFLASKGKLTDLAAHRQGRHDFYFDMEEVKKLAQTRMEEKDRILRKKEEVIKRRIARAEKTVQRVLKPEERTKIEEFRGKNNRVRELLESIDGTLKQLLECWKPKSFQPEMKVWKPANEEQADSRMKRD